MIRPMKRTKTEGDDVRFYCFAKGKQQPRISWSRENGKTLPSRAVVSGKILSISRIRKEDEGEYACTARNIYGSETGITQLRVQGWMHKLFLVQFYLRVEPFQLQPLILCNCNGFLFLIKM